ncbi:organic solute transporter alpha-like protein [Colias croceus]|uniref:organic solute transporter alpha-like protein n=1 Tax=Colias crocea TaxID=72248 RepID=UPI001E2809D6|nr:organic solute transporter alpha-like protein [Colias croceus]
MDLYSEASSGARVLTARHVSVDVRLPDTNNAINTTLLCHSYSLAPDIGTYISALNTYAWVLFICGLFILLALCILYIITLRSALRHWSETKLSVGVILGIYPIVGAMGFVAIIVPRARIITEAVAQEAVMIAMYHIYFMIMAECGGTNQLVRRSGGSHLETRVLPCCCWPCCILPRPQIQKKTLRWLRLLILQMPIIQGIIYFIILILWAEDLMLQLNSFVYMQPFIAASILSGIWGIMMCIRAAEATGAKPRLRFLVVQLVLVIVKLQCGIARVVPDLFNVTCILPLHPSVIVNLIQNMLMMFEMLLLSLWAWRLYSSPPGKVADKVQQVVVAVLDDSINSIDLKCKDTDEKQHTTDIKHVM